MALDENGIKSNQIGKILYGSCKSGKWLIIYWYNAIKISKR
jgi:hypothetical protein